MAARGKRVSKTERQLIEACDLLLVFGTAAFAIGLALTAQGVSELPGGMLPQAWWGHVNAHGEVSDYPVQEAAPVHLETHTRRLTPSSPPGPAVELWGQRDDRLDLIETADWARRGRNGMAGLASCGAAPCSLVGAMTPNWVPQSEENRPPSRVSEGS